MKFLATLAALPLALAAPVIKPRGAEVIPGKYIAVLKPQSGVNALDANSVRSVLGQAPDTQFQIGDFKGMSFSADDAKLQEITSHPDVAYVEPDTVVYANALTSQSNPPYGLGLISHKGNDFSSYVYDSSAGSGTYSYIIDTGIYTSHPDFGGRATFGANFADNSNTDGNGHGTHVAGTTGSSTYGVAKRTNLIAVKVLGSDGSGSNSGVIQGIQWATNDVRSKGRSGKAVANMSLGGTFSQATNNAVAAATQAGLFMAVAAGNDGENAANSSPASEPSACTVGAIDNTKTEAYFSNYGSIVDIFAPGVGVVSTWNNGGTRSLDGTSMATPHITGLGAYLLALEGARSPSALCARIVALANTGIKGLAGSGTPNKIAYNGNGA